MKARPILFSGPMVRALLAGSKTQTRRIVKIDLAPCDDHDSRFRGHEPDGWWCTTCGNGVWFRDFRGFPCPYGAPGDVLWVKERIARSPDLWTYVADGAEVGWPARRDLASKRLDYAPSIHMPKVASRLTLEITEVRVERLNRITTEDAKAEGWDGGDLPLGWYADLWEQINGGGSWDANPWVWAVSFKVHKANVDALANAGAPR